VVIPEISGYSFLSCAVFSVNLARNFQMGTIELFEKTIFKKRKL